MNVFAGKPSDVVIASDKGPKFSYTYPIRVDIAIEHRYQFRGEVIAAGVPLQPLKETTPTLLQYLTIDGAQVILPRSEAVDWSLLLNLIDLIVDRHHSGEVFDIEFHELLQDPVKLIKLDVILKLFGLDYRAHNLLEQLWLVFGTHVLTLADVFWIWGALYPHKDIQWVPESTEVYLQMMACNVLNADAEGRLHPDLRIFFLEEEGKPYDLTCLLEQHYLKYGLGRTQQATSESKCKKRRDTATGHIEESVPSCPPTPPSDPTDAPIFPARWLSPPEPKSPPKPAGIEAFFPDEKWNSRKWDRKWDGKAKNVQKMAAEREGLVSLRRSQAFPENVGKTPLYTEFGYPGWCDRKENSRKKWNGV